MGWAKQQEDNLCSSKRYLKSDFKVGVTRARQTSPPHCVTRPRSLYRESNMALRVFDPLPSASSLI